MLRRIENIFVIFIILCSTSFYNLLILGPGAKASETLGIIVILVLWIFHIVYADRSSTFPKHYTTYIILIFLSLITSMIMAKYSRDQNLSSTLIAQQAIYYYMFYFLLHQLKIKPGDLERIFIFFGLLHVGLFLLQFFLYPKILFNVFILVNRGTVRVYMKGSDYLGIAFFICIQAFLRTNKIKYLLLTFLFYATVVLLGGRQTMAIMAFTLVLFVIFSKRVKSRIWVGLLIGLSIFFVLVMFQGIIQALIIQSQHDKSMGANYIRILTIKYFLTDFYKTSIAYFTGNGMYGTNTNYANQIMSLSRRGFYLGDIGLIGNYVIYGLLFIIGVFGICIKSLRIKLSDNQAYIRFLFIAIVLSLIIGGGFVVADFICFIAAVMYLIDVSNYMSSEYQINRI